MGESAKIISGIVINYVKGYNTLNSAVEILLWRAVFKNFCPYRVDNIQEPAYIYHHNPLSPYLILTGP